MRPDLIDAVQIRSTIRFLVESGSEVGDIADRWKEVDAVRKEAEAGDASAMVSLGDWYYTGEKGLVMDLSLSYRWTKKAADLGFAKGIAYQGYMLYHGNGVEENETEGMMLIGMAAEKGSSSGAFCLARCYAGEGGFKGSVGKDPQKAKHWFQKAIEYQHPKNDSLDEEDLKVAKEYIANLESAS